MGAWHVDRVRRYHEMVAARAGGASYRQIAEHFGITPGHVYVAIKKGPPVDHWAATRERNAAIITMRRSTDASLAVIGGRFGITRERVRQIILKHERVEAFWFAYLSAGGSRGKKS